MKNLIFAFLAFVAFTVSSCSVTSSTLIKSKERFVLGNNPHASFSVKLKNVSLSNLTYYQAPIDGEKQAAKVIKPYQTAQITVDKNTALVIDNQTNIMATVHLKITGDVGLSMGYSKN
jgi:hypothetical protein